jgi:hypothetical protein
LTGIARIMTVSPQVEAAIEARQRTGRPWGGAAFLERLERATGRVLAPGRRGRKPRPK